MGTKKNIILMLLMLLMASPMLKAQKTLEYTECSIKDTKFDKKKETKLTDEDYVSFVLPEGYDFKNAYVDQQKLTCNQDNNGYTVSLKDVTIQEQEALIIKVNCPEEVDSITREEFQIKVTINYKEANPKDVWKIIIIAAAVLVLLLIALILIRKIKKKRDNANWDPVKKPTTDNTNNNTEDLNRLMRENAELKNQLNEFSNGVPDLVAIKRERDDLKEQLKKAIAINEAAEKNVETRLKNNWEQAQAKMLEAQKQVTEAQANAQKKVDEVNAQAQKQVNDAQMKVNEALRQANDAQMKVNEANAKVEEAQAKVKAANERAENAEQTALAKFDQIKREMEDDCQRRIAEVQIKVDEANAKVEEAQTKVDEANQRVEAAVQESKMAQENAMKQVEIEKQKMELDYQDKMNHWIDDRNSVLHKLTENVSRLVGIVDQFNPEAFNGNCAKIRSGIMGYANTLQSRVDSDQWKQKKLGECLQELRQECCRILDSGSDSWMNLLGRLYSYMSVSELEQKLSLEDLSFDLVSDAYVAMQSVLASVGIVVMNCSPGFDSSDDPVTAKLFVQKSSVDRITNWLDDDMPVTEAIPNHGHTVYDFGQLAYITIDDMEIHQGSVIYYNS